MAFSKKETPTIREPSPETPTQKFNKTSHQQHPPPENPNPSKTSNQPTYSNYPPTPPATSHCGHSIRRPEGQGSACGARGARVAGVAGVVGHVEDEVAGGLSVDVTLEKPRDFRKGSKFSRLLVCLFVYFFFGISGCVPGVCKKRSRASKRCSFISRNHLLEGAGIWIFWIVCLVKRGALRDSE